MDRLRFQCEQLLDKDEHVLLDAQVAHLRIGLLRAQGTGRAFLTERRIIWLHGAPPFLLRLFFWLRRLVQIQLDSIERVQRWKHALIVRASGEEYVLQLGQGYPRAILFFFYQVPREAERTTDRWYRALRELIPLMLLSLLPFPSWA